MASGYCGWLLGVGVGCGRRRRWLQLEVVADDGEGLAGDVHFENAIVGSVIEFAHHRADGERGVVEGERLSVESSLDIGLGRERCGA